MTETSAIKLTDVQWTVLRNAKAGHVYRSERGGDLYECYDGAQRTTYGVPKKVTKIVDRLYAQGLLRIGETNVMQRPWLVTDKGERVIAQKDGNP